MREEKKGQQENKPIPGSELVHLRHEYEHANAADRALTGEKYPNPRVTSLPIGAFLPPAFVRKTAPDLYPELEECLSDLWSLNEGYVGEHWTEAVAHIVFSGSHRPLIERLQHWCDTYFLRRLQQINPRDKGDPALTFLRLKQECLDILESRKLWDDPGAAAAIIVVVCDPCTKYVLWFLYERTCKSKIKEGFSIADRYPIPQAVIDAFWDLYYLDTVESDFVQFLERSARTIDPAWLSRRSANSDEDLRERIAGLVDDIQQMRPFLVRNFHPEKTVLELGDGLAVALDWALGPGVAHIFNGTPEEVRRCLVTKTKAEGLLLHINLDGLLSDDRMPWKTASDIGSVCNTTALHANLYILELFHEKLFSFYDQIDFEAIRRRLQQPDKTELDDEELGVTCQDLAEAEPVGKPADEAGPVKPQLRVAPLRLQRLLIVLQEDLGCEISRGKGSEITVYRPGGRKYVLGRHKADYAVPVPIMKALLSRVGIQGKEWIAVCQKRGRCRRGPR